MVIRFLTPVRGTMWRYAAACAMAMVLGSAAAAWAEDIAVIVNAHGPLVGLSREDVRAVYLGDRQFANNEKVSVLHLPEGRVKEALVGDLTGKTLKEYKLHWVQRVFQEGVTLPKVLTDSSAVVADVEFNRASIGYVPDHMVKGAQGIMVLFRVSGP